ncbi:MAG: bifunctional DNA-formamidopyrimidine glycosylase/DNA-(apurinic or apyrimidinic site) lyase [Desulfobulbus sp.]|nr:MAG: bifunctional DNA-formamidopyrimidine glycosylase/DNA-(apurinic or apyrimidinic site) lyase [Desulfobulbus sp.]
MPELPEVEVTRRGLLPFLPGRRIIKVMRSNKRLRSDASRPLLTRHLPGAVIRTIDRRAKYLLFRLDDGAILVLHLGMSGKLSLVAADTPRARHDHLCLGLDNGRELRFNDARRFGSILLWPSDQAKQLEEAFAAQLGMEPLGPDFTPASLLAASRARSLGVKALLMDSRIVAGIGNIYANEILFAAGLHPLTPVSGISRAQWARVVAAGRKILRAAIRAGGSTIADFLGASGHPGYFQLRFAVYKRQGLPCRCCGQSIVRTTVTGRATYFCPACQPSPGRPLQAKV